MLPIKPTAEVISIHALREEGDRLLCVVRSRRHNFYPRPPRGRRLELFGDGRRDSQFLSTPSARRATLTTSSKSNCASFLSTPSARRATSFCMVYYHHRMYFYPRPPRGGRRIWRYSSPRSLRFLSTPSARRATHALRTALRRPYNFYPRPPRGGRLTGKVDTPEFKIFLSTPSARRATRVTAMAV